MNNEELLIEAGRTVGLAGWLCPRCMARAERWTGHAGAPEVRRWKSAEDEARVATAYADFVCAELSPFMQAMCRDAEKTVFSLSPRMGLDRQTLGPVVKGDTKPTPGTMARIAFVLRGGLTGWALHFDTLLLRSTGQRRQP